MQRSLLFRYLNNVLGLKEASLEFFRSHEVLSNRVGEDSVLQVSGLHCYLVYDEEMSSKSLEEMRVKLGNAVEAEFLKGRVATEDFSVKWTKRQDQKLQDQNVRKDGNHRELWFLFGIDRLGFNRSLPEAATVVLLPRMGEIHENPVAKKKAWKEIQLQIARFIQS